MKSINNNFSSKNLDVFICRFVTSIYTLDTGNFYNYNDVVWFIFPWIKFSIIFPLSFSRDLQ